MHLIKDKLLYIGIGVLIVFFFLTLDLPAFWDAKSKFLRADWLYTHQLSTLLVPTHLNSGHPPLWLWGLAGFWTMFGKSLWAARLLLLLVNIGVWVQLLRLARLLFVKHVPFVLVLLLAIEPTLLAQTTNLNNDMLLLFFVLLGLNSLIAARGLWFTIALTGMLFTNLRGIYCLIALGCIQALLYRFLNAAPGGHTSIPWQNPLIKSYRYTLLPYLISIGLFGLFLGYQYQELGWVIVTPNKTYAGHREAVGLMRIVKNIAAFAKNLLEYGRFLVWLPLLYLLFKLKVTKSKTLSVSSRILFLSLVVFLTVFFLGMVPFSNPMGPRYFMICNLLAILLFINLLYESQWISTLGRKLVISLVGLGFITGHFWIYPATIAQGWDSSLAYLNYFPLEQQMFTYIDKNQINTQSIGTNLPLGNRWVSLAKNDNSEDPKFSELDLSSNKYVLFSNIENSTSDQDIQTLRTQWEVIADLRQLGVFLTLYKNPSTP